MWKISYVQISKPWHRLCPSGGPTQMDWQHLRRTKCPGTMVPARGHCHAAVSITMPLPRVCFMGAPGLCSTLPRFIWKHFSRHPQAFHGDQLKCHCSGSCPQWADQLLNLWIKTHCANQSRKRGMCQCIEIFFVLYKGMQVHKYWILFAFKEIV